MFAQEAEAEDDEDISLSAEALQRERDRKAEEWRAQQLRAGTTADDNANFQVLALGSQISWVGMECTEEKSIRD